MCAIRRRLSVGLMAVVSFRVRPRPRNPSRVDGATWPFITVSICRSACSLSATVFDTMQSAGAYTFRSRMCASLAVNRTQMLPAMPVRMTRRVPRLPSSVSRVVSKKPGVFGLQDEIVARGRPKTL